MEEENKKPEDKKSTVDKIRQIIKETLDSDTEIIWEKSSSQWLGYFTIDGLNYRMKIECDGDQVDNFNVWTIKFGWWNSVKNEWRMELTGKNAAFSVFGAIKKGTFEFFDTIKPDIFLFVGDKVRDNLYKKLYSLLALQKKYGFLDDVTQYIYVLMSDNVKAETVKKIREMILSYADKTA